LIQTPDISKRFTLNSSTYITLFVEDGMGSGIDFVWFSIDGGLTYLIYEEPFTIPNTTSTINFGARDNLGNNATTTNLRVLVDDSPPDPDGDQQPDKKEEKPFAENLAQILIDNYLIIMIVLVVLIILAIFLGGRKGKKDEVDFKAEEEIPQVVPMEVIEEVPALEFEEEISDVPPPPPPPLPPPLPPPPPPE
jgi:hypothetical protein